MLTLSPSLTNREVYTVIARIGPHKFRPALTHPFDAESASDASLYKHWLWRQMQNPYTSTYKHLAHLARAHQAGQQVILQVHQNAQHGPILLAALHYLADHLPLLPKARPTCSSTSYHFQSWLEPDDDLLDERRFVWVIGRRHRDSPAKLGYLWDTDGVLTVLLPEHGLVKVGRCPGGFWAQRSAGVINRHVRIARIGRHGLSAPTEQLFVKLVKRQQQAERTVVATYRKGGSGRLLPDKIRYDERYDPWLLQSDECIAEPNHTEQQAEAEITSFLARYRHDTRSEFHQLLPTKYTGEHVRPVIKTKPDGSRWVLTPAMQARGALHLYQSL